MRYYNGKKYFIRWWKPERLISFRFNGLDDERRNTLIEEL